MPKITDAHQILAKKMGLDPASDSECLAIEQELLIAQLVYDARQAAGLSQPELAAACGISESVIAEIEEAEFQGDMLTILRQIAKALNTNLQIQFSKH